MKVTTRFCFPLLLVPALLAILVAPVAAEVVLPPENVEWQNQGTDVVFHLRFYNNDPVESSLPGTARVYSQLYGAFLPDWGPIGDEFTIPVIEPESFFDIYLSVPRSSLPPSAEEIISSAPFALGRLAASSLDACPPDDHWDGNVDVLWNVPGFPPGAAQVHNGTLQAQAGGASCSLIHVVTNCVGTASWVMIGGCAGFTVSLVNEDYTPAPNPVPAGWSGYIRSCVDASVPYLTTCCMKVRFTCQGTSADVNLCIQACDLGGVPVEAATWGRIKSLYR